MHLISDSPPLSEQALLAVIDDIKPQVRSLAYKYHLEAEDLAQDVVVEILENAEKVASMPNPTAFSVGIARNVARHQFSRPVSVSAESLEAPLPGDTTLNNIIPAPGEPGDTTTQCDKRAQIVHDALHRMPHDEQLYLQRVYELQAFIPGRSPHGSCKKLKAGRSEHAISRSALYHLRHDAQLANICQQA